MISTITFNNIQGSRKLKDAYVGPFLVAKLHGPNAVEVILTGEFSRKHPTFPVSLLKHYKTSTSELRKNMPKFTEAIIPFEKDTEKTVLKVLQNKRVRQNNQDILLFLVRYKNLAADHDEWLPAEKIPKKDKVLRQYRMDKKRSQD